MEWIELGSKEDFLEWFGGTSKSNHLTGVTAGMTRYYKLTDDITIDVNSTVYYLSYGEAEFYTYIDLGGHTLTYSSPLETGATRLFGSYNPNAVTTIVNGTIVNTSQLTTSHGALFLMSEGDLVMEDVTINDISNSAYTGNGKIISSVAKDGYDVTLTNVDINVGTTKNLSYGLAIRKQYGSLTMTDCNLTSTATGKVTRGGLVYNNGSELTLDGCTFTGGYATYGGNLFVTNANATITDCSFIGGKATGYGGNIEFINDTSGSHSATLTGCTITGQSKVVASHGGNIFGQGYAFSLIDCTVTGGKAGSGGAIYNVNQPLTITNTDISGGYATADGGNIQQKNGSITINSGTISGGKADVSGGNISIANVAKAYFKGGTVTGGQASDGGNIATLIGSTNGPTLNFQGITVTGGTATNNGGNVCVVATAGYAGKPTMNLSAGIITDGTATGNGGNVYLAGLAKEAAVTDAEGNVTKEAIAQRLVTFTMTGGTIGGTPAQGKEYAGKAENGGNLYATYATADISGGEISNGYVGTHGGNLYPAALCTMTLSGTVLVDGGEAAGRGGNIYMSSTNTVLKIQSGTVQNGTSGQEGGNIYHGNGKCTITGGVITGGVAESCGGNLYAGMGYGNSASASGILTIRDDGEANTPLAQITNGTARVLDGGNIYVNCGGNTLDTGANKFVLGNFLLSGGNAGGVGDELYINGITILEILPEFSQQIPTYISAAGTNGLLPDVLPGGVLTETRASASGVFTGKLVIENHDNIFVYAVENDTKLHLAGAAIVDDQGSKTWYKGNEEAVAAYAGGVLQAAPGDLVLTEGSYTVDIAGHDVKIYGLGRVTCFDSANDTYTTFGTITLDGPTLENERLQAVGDKLYYWLETDGAYSFHRVEVQLISASMRPSIGGIYYTGRWSCDSVLAQHIDGFGVAASTAKMPENDFATEPNPTALWTAFGKDVFQSGVTKTGVMISGILKDEKDGATQNRIDLNSQYAQKDIHAKAYITIDGVNYTGGGLSYSLYDILKIVSDNLADYAAHTQNLQNFMARWSAKGLSGEPWDALNFQLDPAIEKLNTLYSGVNTYYGELHDHAETYGTSDGKQTLDVWKTELAKLQMDFAAIVDHKQSAHMYLDEWDNTIFLGGSEAAGRITDRTGVYLHYNMIFSDPAGLEAVVSSFPEYGWQYYPEDYTGTNAEKLAGGWHFGYPSFTAERFTEVCEAVYANGGFVSLVHPKSEGYIESDDPADAFFMDGTAIEVFYTYRTTRDGWQTAANYKLWKSMIDAGYKVYATAGNDEHDMPSDKAVSVLHATERQASAYVEALRAGNFVAGGVDVRTAIGDTAMGGTTSFTGKRMALSVNGFHVSLYKPDHTYRVDVITDKGVAYSQEFSCTENLYHAFDVDADAMYYYVEIHDVTDQSMLAIGNPIWNADKESAK